METKTAEQNTLLQNTATKVKTTQNLSELKDWKNLKPNTTPNQNLHSPEAKPYIQEIPPPKLQDEPAKNLTKEVHFQAITLDQHYWQNLLNTFAETFKNKKPHYATFWATVKFDWNSQNNTLTLLLQDTTNELTYVSASAIELKNFVTQKIGNVTYELLTKTATTQEQTTTKRPYTDHQKLAYLADKYPDVRLLIDTFGLTTE